MGWDGVATFQPTAQINIGAAFAAKGFKLGCFQNFLANRAGFARGLIIIGLR